jgi:hypothetical protein
MGVRGVDVTNQADRRGPITSVHNGRGVRPWLPELNLDPGYVSVVTKLRTLYSRHGQPRRVCWRYVSGLLEARAGGRGALPAVRAPVRRAAELAKLRSQRKSRTISGLGIALGRGRLAHLRRPSGRPPPP